MINLIPRSQYFALTFHESVYYRLIYIKIELMASQLQLFLFHQRYLNTLSEFLTGSNQSSVLTPIVL